MTRLLLNQVSKRFQTNWVFKNLDLDFNAGEPLLINGPNGSGKSTLLKILSGWESPNRGDITYFDNQQKISIEHVYKSLSLCTPYLDLIEELTLEELLLFHQSFKPLQRFTDAESFADAIEMKLEHKKAIKSYSSGMKQRVKLGLVFFGTSSLVLLDEPISNLDKSGINWYKKNIENVLENRLVAVCSNDISEEHFFCSKKINLNDFK